MGRMNTTTRKDTTKMSKDNIITDLKDVFDKYGCKAQRISISTLNNPRLLVLVNPKQRATCQPAPWVYSE